MFLESNIVYNYPFLLVDHCESNLITFICFSYITGYSSM